MVLGHIIFVPKAEARRLKMLHHERMPITRNDDKILVVEAVGFCSIGGQNYRRRGIGRAMVEMIIDWSRQNGWTKLQIFGVPSGLFPGHWMDSCMPPRPFWEKFGFEVIGKVRTRQTWEQIKAAHLRDDPRNNPTEMELKRKTVESIKDPTDSEINWAFDFDMAKSL
jgi:GNAT superfamily N-acetyltransferase